MAKLPGLAGGAVFTVALACLVNAAGAKEPVARQPTAKAATDKAFRAAKKEYQARIHNKKPAERVAALKLLSDFQTGESADLIYVTLLDDRADEVRQAAIDLLASWRDQTEVTDRLLQRMTTATRKEGMDIRAISALQALAGTEEDDLQFKLLAYLDEFLGTPLADQHLLHEMIDEQSAQKADAEVMRMLMLFTRTQLFERQFGFRRCLVQGLTQIKDREAITHLINLLPRFKGLVQFDTVSHLTESTGQNFGDDAAKWKVWWTENRNITKVPDKRTVAMGPYAKFGDYYGIPICAKRVVFVLDTSGSMRGAKIEAAKSELMRVIRELPKEVYFSVIAFDGKIRVWQRDLVPATEQMKHIAVNVVLEQQLGAQTASYDALEAAFELNPEAIYFLSDGAPVGGKIDDPAEIVGTISAVNRVRRVSIHSVGVDTNIPSAAVFAKFMKTLAESNWGVYKAVN